MKMKRLAWVSLFGLLASTAAFANGGWAVIVWNPQTNSVGSFHGSPTRDEGETMALNYCGTGCAGVSVGALESGETPVRETWMLNGWVAVATDNQGRWASSGIHDSRSGAERAALASCGNSSCFVVRSLSSFVDQPDIDGTNNIGLLGPAPAQNGSGGYTLNGHTFHVGDTVVVNVSQGRTTGTIQRIDADGYVVVATPSGYDNYQGPISQVLLSLQQLDGYQVGETVVVNVSQGRTTGTIQRIDSDGNVLVATPSGYDDYQGPISGLLATENSYTGPNGHYRVGDTVVVTVSQGRTTGTVERIDSDGTVLVATGSGYDNYLGPAQSVLTILPSLDGFNTGDNVGVTVSQGRTTGTIERIDSDGMVLVATPSGYDNYLGSVTSIRHLLNEMDGFSVGETVVVVVSQGRTTGTIERIESDGYAVVDTPSGFDNYMGPIYNLIHLQ